MVRAHDSNGFRVIKAVCAVCPWDAGIRGDLVEEVQLIMQSFLSSLVLGSQTRVFCLCCVCLQALTWSRWRNAAFLAFCVVLRPEKLVLRCLLCTCRRWRRPGGRGAAGHAALAIFSSLLLGSQTLVHAGFSCLQALAVTWWRRCS
jgi:hypothetical protein